MSSEHVIEHLEYAGGVNLLCEAFRVLRPGGRIRISTPAMEFLVRLLDDDRSPLHQHYVAWSHTEYLDDETPATALAVVNNFVRDWGHLFIYDRATLEGALCAAGFVNVVAQAVGVSADPQFQGIDNVGRMPDGFLALESMVYEADKPACPLPGA